MYAFNGLGNMDNPLTFTDRLCKLFACHVRGVLLWVRHLTVSTLRLNSRDYVRNRPTTANLGNSLNLSSIRIEPSSEAHESKSGQAGVSDTVHCSATLNFAWNKSDNDVGPTFEGSKPVRPLCLLAAPGSILILSAGCMYLPFQGRVSTF
jgi:hypothetical protein